MQQMMVMMMIMRPKGWKHIPVVEGVHDTGYTTYMQYRNFVEEYILTTV